MLNNIYLNTASSGLVPADFTKAANELQAALAANASIRAEQWRDEEQPAIRQVVAEFFGAGVDNVAMVPNFSWAMNGIVHSLRGDEKVLLYKNDYPSLLEPFRINDFNITWIDDKDDFIISMQKLQEKLLTEKIELLAISHVQWLSGFKTDLHALGKFCREHDIWLIIDATQSLGAIAINPAMMDIDVLISSNYKWMNSGFGTGVMYMSDEFLAAYTPKVGGNNSYGIIDGEMKYTPSVRSFEPGHPNMYGLTVMRAAMEHKLTTGVGVIEEHNRKLTQLLLDNLQDIPVLLIGDATTDNRASMIFLRDADGSLLKYIKDSGILVSGRMGHVRISMHYYNTEADVMALVTALKKRSVICY